jgi:AraC-like DNA-binding protein
MFFRRKTLVAYDGYIQAIAADLARACSLLASGPATDDDLGVPRIRITPVVATRDVSAIRALCDGCDPARSCDEHSSETSLWLVTTGVFELRDSAGRHVIDPTQAIVMPKHHMMQIRHPSGPDTCVVFRGPIVDALAAHGARLVRISTTQIAQIAAALDDRDGLALAEALSHLSPNNAVPDRDLSAAIERTLRARSAESISLEELAATTGYSVFHTCRVFRRTTGYTIHGFRRELRLRHALARILESGESLTDIAVITGFASQSHLTNLFRARFGITPGKARTRDGLRMLGQHAG